MNLVINTDRRTYHMELRSTEDLHGVGLWRYPEDQLIALRRQNAEAQAAQPVSSGIDLAKGQFPLRGDRRPRAMATAARIRRRPPSVYRVPRGIGQGEMPPLFVVGPRAATLRTRELPGAQSIPWSSIGCSPLCRIALQRRQSQKRVRISHRREASVVNSDLDPGKEEGKRVRPSGPYRKPEMTPSH